MDLIKQYITQSITAASNNLRLNSQQIEVVALLREVIIRSDDLEGDIKRMKRVTEFSTLAIRLNEIYNYLAGRVDILKLSDQFKIHSGGLIKDLTNMLETVTPPLFKAAANKLNLLDKPKSTMGMSGSFSSDNNSVVNIDLSKRKSSDEILERQSESIKEKLIFDDEKEDDEILFQNYEKTVLEPIKPLDTFLKKISPDELYIDELDAFVKKINANAELSDKIGFEIIGNMHKIIANALLLIKVRNLMPGKDTIVSLRACLIVIVAVVKGKEVDITNYLNKAEEFGKRLKMIKVRNE
ncbi:MAG: hypothetical protein K8H86_07970 [Ignavibacteriaceae bacterium]|nr:hypothetical protein [Ignavibacteriaceae bacterium]